MQNSTRYLAKFINSITSFNNLLFYVVVAHITSHHKHFCYYCNYVTVSTSVLRFIARGGGGASNQLCHSKRSVVRHVY